jgi:hypothetical protein
MRHVIVLSLLAAAAQGQEPRPRAILISFDGLSEAPARAFADSGGALMSVLRDGVCADGSRPSFTSVTPTGHAAIWTGAYSSVNGIFASANGALPLAENTILETTDGYRVPAFGAEPIWLAAVRQGKRVFSHMATQSPGPPAYPYAVAPSPDIEAKRRSAATTARRPELVAVNVYNERVAEERWVTERTHPTHAAPTWRNLSQLGASPIVASREVSWEFTPGGDSLHALLLRSQDGVGRVVLGMSRDAARGVVARAVPTDTSRAVDRPLARNFSESLRIDLPNNRRAFLFARLFELSPDLSRYSLYVSEGRIIQGNRPDVALSYDEAVRGVPGNGADRVLQSGGFGPTLLRGGDGSAEMKYLETAELVTRQYMRGAEFGWARSPDLLVDYLPYPDEALHNWYAIAHSATPGISPEVRARAARLLSRAYDLVDRRVRQLRTLADASPGTMLVVTGEHGMRPSWLTFRPNVVLAQAGLLAVDTNGAIDLTRTKAAASRDGWILVNRDTRRGGIVPRDSVDAILGRVEQALRLARGPDGAPIVTQIWRATSPGADSLGLAGPAGGDLYYGLAAGYYANAATRGEVAGPMERPRGEHGFPSVDRDMWPALCMLGSGASARRIGPARAIDIAPTVSEWLGISPPADATGRSMLKEIRGR